MALSQSNIERLKNKIEKGEARICIIGLGYVGLPTAVHFAERGFKVIGADVRKDVVEMLNKGKCHLKDLNIEEKVAKVVAQKMLKATEDVPEAVKESDVILIIVPTPVREDKQPDLSYLTSAGEFVSVGMGKEKGRLVVLESTVYPGVTEEVLKPILEKNGLKAGEDFGLAYCPERYNPGDPEHTIEKVARIVGGITPQWAETTRELYKKIIKKEVTVVKNIKTAEAAKVIENTQRDLNIALMNELAMIFERMGIDIIEVIEAAKTKWNFNVYYPGAGVGGHCLPVDPYYLVKKAEELGYHAQIITAGRSINDSMPHHVFELLVEALNQNMRALKNSHIVILGLSYKENVGDMRESPVKQLIDYIKRMEANITVIDPHIPAVEIQKLGVIAGKDIYSDVSGADAIILMTAHDEFKNIDFKRLKRVMRTRVIIDGRRIYSVEDLKDFTFRAIGRDPSLDC